MEIHIIQFTFRSFCPFVKLFLFVHAWMGKDASMFVVIVAAVDFVQIAIPIELGDAVFGTDQAQVIEPLFEACIFGFQSFESLEQHFFRKLIQLDVERIQLLDPFALIRTKMI